MTPYTFQELRTYAQLYEIAHRFAEGKLGFVIVRSPPGTGKTDTFRESILKRCVIYEGGLSPFKFFLNHYENRDTDVVFDDVDEIFRTPAGITLFKSLCNTHKPKTLMYEKATKALADLGVPNRYATTSNVMMFCNTIAGHIEENLGAVLDRAHRYVFSPTPQEIHREVGKWFKDEVVYKWIGDRLHLIGQPSMRSYVKAKEQKDAGLNWHAFLLNEWAVDPKLAAVLTILNDPKMKTKQQRAERFAEWGHGEVATYMRMQAKAIDMGLAPKPKKSPPQKPPAAAAQRLLIGPPSIPLMKASLKIQPTPEDNESIMDAQSEAMEQR